MQIDTQTFRVIISYRYLVFYVLDASHSVCFKKKLSVCVCVCVCININKQKYKGSWGQLQNTKILNYQLMISYIFKIFKVSKIQEGPLSSNDAQYSLNAGIVSDSQSQHDQRTTSHAFEYIHVFMYVCVCGVRESKRGGRESLIQSTLHAMLSNWDPQIITLSRTTTHDLLVGANFYKKQLFQEQSRILAFHCPIL